MREESKEVHGRVAGGIACQAADTGRVLLIQRKFDKHDPGEAQARWEMPGGCLSPTDRSVWHGALREWSEETGATLPDSIEPLGGWVSEDGDYEGFVVRVPSESFSALSPQKEEVSDIGWWDVDDLADEKVREKVKESLEQIVPLLEKSTWQEAHRHTDEIIDHYAPLVRDAMAQVYQGDTIQNAMRSAYGVSAATKARGQQTTYQTARQRALRVLQNVAISNPPMALASLAVPGALAGASAVGGAAGLGAVIAGIYGAAAVQGAEWALLGIGAAALVPRWLGVLRAKGPVPGAQGEPWHDGSDRDAVSTILKETPDSRLAMMMNQLGQRITGITETERERIADVIARGVVDGTPMSEMAAKVHEVVADEKRASLIAETEYIRAMTIAARETYQRNNVPYVQWLHQPDACPQCMENAAVSPIPITETWPNGNVPVHPRCRCAEAPVVVVGGKPVL